MTKTYLIEYNDTEAIKVVAKDLGEAWDAFMERNPEANVQEIREVKEVPTMVVEEEPEDWAAEPLRDEDTQELKKW